MTTQSLYDVILSPINSEKSFRLSQESNQVMLQVHRMATKAQIREAFEKIYGQTVLSIQVFNRKGKVKLFKRRIGQLSSTRYAYVRLPKDANLNWTDIR